MRKFAIIAGMMLALGACKKNKWDKAISDTEGFKDQMCACKDKACTEDVHKKYKEWEKGMMSDMGKDEKPPDNIIEKAEKVEKEMRECRNKYRDADKPAGGDMAPPPAGGEAPPAAPPPAGGEAPKTP
jgi:hypothetical protein